MSAEKGRKPLPHEHKEIARGSGPAAILLFLHIAVIGYLGYVIYFLLTGNESAFWNLLPFRSAWIFYFPAVFALVTAIPSDPLTRSVARVAQVVGFSALLVYGGGLMYQWLDNGIKGGSPSVITACAVAAGTAAALLTRLVFAFGIRKGSAAEGKITS
jgi:hypothetical protein